MSYALTDIPKAWADGLSASPPGTTATGTPLYVGTSDLAGLLYSAADVSDPSLSLFLADATQALHITDKGARATDWGLTNGTDPIVYIHSNTTPTTDYLLIGNHNGTQAQIAAVGATLDITAVGSVVFNEASGDVDIRIESNALSSFIVVDASECLNGCLSIGAAAPTNPQAMLALRPPANATGVTADQSYFHMQVLPGGATVIPLTTCPVAASVNIHEPNLTATGTVTDAVSLRIVDAPTEGTLNWALWVDSGVTRLDGTAYIGDTTNANVTLGLTLNQAAADDQILAVKSSDVSHGVTDVAETDTYGAFLKAGAADGGLRVLGITDVTTALDLYGISTTEDATDAPTTSSATTLIIRGAVKSGTGVAALGATGNLLAVMNTTVNEFIIKGDGELYSNQSATVGTFDKYEDAIMCRDLSYVLSREYEKVTQYHRAAFIEAGIIAPDPEGDGGMFSITKMNMLAICAIGQLEKAWAVMQERVAGLETQLAAALSGGASQKALSAS